MRQPAESERVSQQQQQSVSWASLITVIGPILRIFNFCRISRPNITHNTTTLCNENVNEQIYYINLEHIYEIWYQVKLESAYASRKSKLYSDRREICYFLLCWELFCWYFIFRLFSENNVVFGNYFSFCDSRLWAPTCVNGNFKVNSESHLTFVSYSLHFSCHNETWIMKRE